MPEFRRHSATSQTAYHDLLSLLLDDAATDLRGAPTLRARGDRHYWYDRYRVGTEMKERYLGEDTPELRSRVERYEELRSEQRKRRTERSRLIRLLRSEQLLGLDSATGSLVAALSRTGLFRLGGVLVGTVAFLLYEGELGLKLSLDDAARTTDIDIASFEKLALAMEDEAVDPGLTEFFAQLNFAPVPGLERGRTWRWRQSGGEALVEFLTPSFRDDEGLRDIAALGVSARALHHLEYLIKDPLHAAAIYRDGILVRAPRPERYAIHKLIVADRRLEGPDRLKARKDIRQAEILMSILAEDRPADLNEAYEDAVSRGPQWRQRIERSLERTPEIARLIESAA
jgi:hypothetical protein